MSGHDTTREGREPMRFAYADPPYPGQARRLYGAHPDFAGEVDHAELIARLVDEFPDGWALSTGSKWLQELLALCPPGVRVLAWVKTMAPPFSVRVQFTWEPVLLFGGRRWRRGDPRTVRDHLICAPFQHGFRGPARREHVTGAKPERFAEWLYACFGAGPDDELVDLFPGSGIVGETWARIQAQPELLAEASA